MESSSAQGTEHDHGAPEAQLRHERRADADSGQGRAGAQRSAARGRGADHRPGRLRTTSSRRCTSGFSSKDLDPNQITDYLTRVVQPKLSAISGVQRADILGARTFAMRIWLKTGSHGRARASRPSEVRDALARNNYLSALGQTKGSMVSVNLVANTDLQTPEEFRQLVVKRAERRRRPPRRHRRRRRSARRTTSRTSASTGEGATFMGVWVLPTANSLDVIARSATRLPAIRAQLPAGMKVGIPYDSTAYIHDAINEVLQHADRDAAHRRSSSSSSSSARSARSSSRSSRSRFR